ncbi:MAG: hypothetical protein ACI9XC_002007 [Gammaproteobacteria bacterium]|jgi:hypothetical protein
MNLSHLKNTRTIILLFLISPVYCVFAQQQSTITARQNTVLSANETQAQVVEYSADFFDRYQPDTALDMVQQIPGFDLDDGAQSRGFGSAAGNILINGRRPSSKEDVPTAILSRIPARLVERIDLIRGQVRGVNLQGQTVVANIFLRDDEPASVRWDTAVRKHFDVDRLFMTGDISVSDRWQDIDYNIGLNFERNSNGESGIEDIFNGSNNLVEKRIDDSLERGHEGSGNIRASTMLGETLFQINTDINISKGDRLQGSRRIPQLLTSAASRSVSIRDENDNLQIELGADAERNIFRDVDGKIILLYFRRDQDSISTQDTVNASGKPLSARLANKKTVATEAIGRLELDWSGRIGHAIQLNLEGTFNALDGSLFQTVDSGTGPIEVDVLGANTRVEETRWDLLLKDTWTLGKFEFDYGLGMELSQISQSGDAENVRDFTFLKPHSILTYSPDQDVQTQIRVAREVSQLDFNDFVSATVFEDDDIARGNPDLRPETTWVTEISHERRFGELSVVQLTVFHHWISNVLDLLPLSSEFEAPGNIGKGRRWGAEFGSTLPLDWLGIVGSRLDISARWQDSTVVDPVTGDHRVLSGGKGFSGFSRTSNNAFRGDYEYALIFDFRQDFEQAKVAWGWVVRGRSHRTLFNVNELDVYDEGIESDAFIETTRWLNLKIRIIGENLTNARQQRNRTVFFGERDLSLVDFLEIEKDRDGRRVILQLSGSF